MKATEVLAHVDVALKYFTDQEIKPTLRTLFYYLVSNEVIANTQTTYKILSRMLVKARKIGRYPWDFMEDKTRVVLGELQDKETGIDKKRLELFKKKTEKLYADLTLEKMLEETFDYLQPYFTVSTWTKQPLVCEIWIEKEALASTIEAWTKKYGIPIRVNRGYSSWTFIYNNVKQLKDTLSRHKKANIYYLGDLDPSGVDIERFLKASIKFFGLNKEHVKINRLAVTSEQVKKYNLPPRPKDSKTLEKLQRDPRTKNYREKYVAELDALVVFAPKAFRKTIGKAVESNIDRKLTEELKKKARQLNTQAKELLAKIKQKSKQKILKEMAK